MFQKSVLQNHLAKLDTEQVELAFTRFKQVYSAERIENIKNLKEEQYQEGFIRDIFVNVFGYILSPDTGFNLQLEFKNQTNNKKVDAAIIRDGQALAVIELKSTKTKNLDVVTEQAFSYKNHQQGCLYVITSNFQKLRFYIEYANNYIEFNLFKLDKAEFYKLYLLLHYQYLMQDLPLNLQKQTKQHEKEISKQFYRDYSKFKQQLFNQFCQHSTQFDTLVLFQKSQKFLDRLLFVLFAEDTGLLDPNSAENEIVYWQQVVDLGVAISLYQRFNQFFAYLDSGFKSNIYNISQYNGGLFAPDVVLDQLIVDDEVLQIGIPQLAKYDFSSELDVNILGHIFEHSLNELEEVKAQIQGETLNKQITKRKKDGIFYTPQYITTYIVEQTLGQLCHKKRQALGLINIEFDSSYRTKTGRLSKKGKILFTKLDAYKNWLFDLKIVDPACGSGAFLNQALHFLITEHQKIDDIITELTGSIPFDTDKAILEKNIYGVDINEESVEITQLSLWLRTAKRQRTLSHLNNNIQCGNSLIDDEKIAGNKAFNWTHAFPNIMQQGGFDVVIGNPPYGAALEYKSWLKQKFAQTSFGTIDSYKYFIQQGTELAKNGGILGYIIPDSYLKKDYFADLRSYMANQFSDIRNIHLGDGIFDGVNLPTAIILLADRQNHKKRVFEQVAQFYSADKNVKNQQLNLIDNQLHSDVIIEKLVNHKKTVALIDLFNQVMGVKVYQKGKGRPKQTHLEKQQNSFIAATQSKDYAYPFISQGIGRYYYDDSKTQFIKYGEWLAEPREIGMFDEPKVIVREVINPRIFATYIEQPAIVKNIAAVIVAKNTSYDLKYVLAVLNTKLLTFYINTQSPKQQNKSYPSFTSKLIKNIPIVTATSRQQKPFINYAQQMLVLHQTIKIKQTKFIHRVTTHFNLSKPNRAIIHFYELDFKTWLEALKKHKIELSLKQQDTWEEYFDSYKSEINQIQTEIETIDKNIDKLVYKLYGLSKQEIDIIEQAVSS